MESNSKDSPDSTTLNNTDRPKVPPLILLGTSTGGTSVSSRNSPIISRVSYNAATDSYCHVPTTYNNNTSNNSTTKVILIPSKSNLDKLSYMIKQDTNVVDGCGSNSSSSSSSSSSSINNSSSATSSSSSSSSNNINNKTTYGSQSRTSASLPVRNFLRPSMSLTSKFSKTPRSKVFTAKQQSNQQQQPGTTNNNNNIESANSSNHDSSSSTTTTNNANSRPVATTTYFTTSSENPNQSIKLHIRRAMDQSESVMVHQQQQPQQQEQVSVESPDSSVDSSTSASKALGSASRNYIDDDHDMCSPSRNNSHINSSSDEASPKINQTPVIVIPNNRKVSNSVIRQLHPELLKQVEKQSHGNVVEISIDDGAPTPNRHNSSNATTNNGDSNRNILSDDEDSGEYAEPEEGDMEVSEGECNSVSESRPNTITITIGEDGVISESGAVEEEIPQVDSRRTKRKRKPAKPYVPDMVIPRLKIRRRNENEAEGSPSVSFSFEAVAEKDQLPKVDSTNAEVNIEAVDLDSTPEPSSEPPRKQGRGRPKGSGNKNKTPATPKPPGRGRGRPKGSTNKTKAEKDMLKAAATVKEEAIPKENGEIETLPITPVSIPLVPIDLLEDNKKDIKAEEDGETEVSSTPAKRARAARGSRNKSATPRSRRAVQPRKSRVKKTPAKAKAEVDKTPRAPPVQVFEEETRMSADIKPPIPPSVALASVQDEESVGASNVSSTSTSATGTKTKKFTKDLVPDRKPVTAETLTEYAWPQPQNGQSNIGCEMYMLQEQVCEYLGVKSFKRKYPDLKRRFVDMEERDFLRSQKFVSESECDLGLTALCSSDVLDLMFNDFPDKYEEFNRVLQERKEKELAKIKGATTTTSTPPVRDRSAEFYRRCLKSTAKWNALLNRQRMEERQCAFDLQTYTLHYQQGKMKVLPKEATQVGHYPVTVLPGQYCDYFKPYTDTELKYLPLNTVLYGPVKGLQVVSNGVEAQSDAESASSSSDDSSSDDDSSSSSDDSEEESEEGTKSGVNKENRVSSPAVVRTCKTCEGDHTKNKDGQPEPLLHCTKCDVPNHPSCLDLRVDMLPFIKKYNWQCTDCKNCIECNDPADEDKMLFCDLCDRGYHIYCVGLRKVPTGRWHCRVCSVCFSCGCTQASPEDRLAEWHHEFKKGEKNSRHFVHSLCVACHKLYKKGQYCPSCLKVHLRLDDTKNLSECWSCEKWVHKECIKRPGPSVFGFMCDPCDTAFRAKTKGLPPNQRLNNSFISSNSNSNQ